MQHLSHLGAHVGCAAGDKFMVAFVGHQSSTVQVYDAASGNWSSTDLSLPRFGSGMVATGVAELALFAGGVLLPQAGQDVLVFTDTVDLYDTQTGHWSVSLLSQPRAFMATASLGSRAYFGGGLALEQGAHAFSDVVDIYDAATGDWSTARLPAPRWGLSAVAAADRVFFAGGYDPQIGRESDVIDIYDTRDGSWSSARLSQPRLVVIALELPDHVLFACGGVHDPSTGVFLPSGIIDVLDLSNWTWHVETLPELRGGVSGTVLEGRAYFGGGLSPGGGVDDLSGRVDVFDAAARSWSTAQLVEPRSDCVAGSVAGRAIFAGGYGRYQGSGFPGPGLFARTEVDILPGGGARVTCAGDGSAGLCPCGNQGDAASGCASSVGTGAILASAGCSLLPAASLTFRASSLPPNVALTLFSSDAPAWMGAPFGDGLRCVGASPRRLAIAYSDTAGEAAFGPGLPPGAEPAPGSLHRFQLHFRDPGSPCGSGFNLTNALELTFL